MAEELLPRVSLATWKDRAVAARAAGKDAPLREVRSIVSGASAVLLDEEGRELVATLRDSLQARVTALREAWLARITGALEAGRVTEALRVSSRPPEPAARIPADLAVRMAEAASAAMAPGVSEADWSELLDAVVDSPVRRTVKPAGLPEHAGEDLLASARRAAGLVPEVARLLGLPIPPPPGPRPLERHGGPPHLRAPPRVLVPRRPGSVPRLQPSTPCATRNSSTPSTRAKSGTSASGTQAHAAASLPATGTPAAAVGVTTKSRITKWYPGPMRSTQPSNGPHRTCTPVSSSSSRSTAWARVSLGSTRPPGMVQRPACGGCPRRTRRIDPALTATPPTATTGPGGVPVVTRGGGAS